MEVPHFGQTLVATDGDYRMILVHWIGRPRDRPLDQAYRITFLPPFMMTSRSPMLQWNKEPEEVFGTPLALGRIHRPYLSTAVGSCMYRQFGF